MECPKVVRALRRASGWKTLRIALKLIYHDPPRPLREHMLIVLIYTDWVNRYLSKAPNYKPIDDICNELRDYRLVAKLIQVVGNFAASSKPAKMRKFSEFS
ncbi:hypothetical protein ANCCEY_04713 [Ancylostoma ceylanicum]|uniref:Calponin-homology (CH) domain-containing protein n=1 Tax=Ancylostoma ceylanicum TaxID=53326 RepID=A0A0D6LY98_9BILA|nr:hypothetical protein ANCCEY_04713 [Ancylostoma ceylanicum]